MFYSLFKDAQPIPLGPSLHLSRLREFEKLWTNWKWNFARIFLKKHRIHNRLILSHLVDKWTHQVISKINSRDCKCTEKFKYFQQKEWKMLYSLSKAAQQILLGVSLHLSRLKEVEKPRTHWKWNFAKIFKKYRFHDNHTL